MPRTMKRALVVVSIALACLVACKAKPEVTPMSLRVPPPPDPHPGAIRVYGDHLAQTRVRHVTEQLRAIEPKILADYEDYLHEAPGVEGRIQLRIGINKDGKVAQVTRVYSEVASGLTMQVRQTLEGVTFDPGPEAYVYYTLAFRSDPFEVQRVNPDFAADPPVVIASVENRTAFDIPAVSATVTVLGPEQTKPLRVYRRRLSEPFAPGEHRDLRIPVGGEWATERNSFLVTVRPARPKASTDEEPKKKP
jgi:hypothetical protein